MFGSVLYGLLINIAITLGVWTQDVVDWTDLEERADHADDLEDGEALVTTIDTIGRVCLFFSCFAIVFICISFFF